MTADSKAFTNTPSGRMSEGKSGKERERSPASSFRSVVATNTATYATGDETDAETSRTTGQGGSVNSPLFPAPAKSDLLDDQSKDDGKSQETGRTAETSAKSTYSGDTLAPEVRPFSPEPANTGLKKLVLFIDDKEVTDQMNIVVQIDDTPVIRARYGDLVEYIPIDLKKRMEDLETRAASSPTEKMLKARNEYQWEIKFVKDSYERAMQLKDRGFPLMGFDGIHYKKGVNVWTADLQARLKSDREGVKDELWGIDLFLAAVDSSDDISVKHPHIKSWWHRIGSFFTRF